VPKPTPAPEKILRGGKKGPGREAWKDIKEKGKFGWVPVKRRWGSVTTMRRLLKPREKRGSVCDFLRKKENRRDFRAPRGKKQ